MFEKYKEWKLLQLFLETPEQGLYTKEIARHTGIGAGTVNTFLRHIQNDDILIKEVVGNVHLYKLNNELALVKQLKIFHTLLTFTHHQLIEKLLQENNTITSIILYGSHANGENDSKSDIDILCLLHDKTSFTQTLQTLEHKIKNPISLQQMTLPDWQKIKENDKPFYESIIEKHVVLYGSGLP